MARKPMSQAHRDKIATGVRKYHAKCRQNGVVKKRKHKKKITKSAPLNLASMDGGARMLDKANRREGILKSIELSKRIRGK